MTKKRRTGVDKLVSEFREYKIDMRIKSKTLDEYGKSIHRFADFLQEEREIGHIRDTSFYSVTMWEVQTYVSRLKNEAGLKYNSVQKELGAIKSFYEFLRLLGKIENNPCSKVRIPKDEEKAEKKFMQIEEADHMVEMAQDLQFKTILALGNWMGLRINETTSLLAENIDLNKNTIKFLRKGGKWHTLPISKHVLPILVEYLGSIKVESGKIFKMNDKDIQKTFRAFADSLGYTEEGRYSYHKLRSCCCSRLYANGLDVASIAKVLNHSHISITMKYLDISNDTLMDKLADF